MGNDVSPGAAGGGDPDFRRAVALSRLLDPMPTLEALARSTGTATADVVHHALVRYASDGAAALLALDPPVLRDLVAARRAEDWRQVGALLDWLAAGLESDGWRHGRPADAAPRRRQSESRRSRRST